MRVQFGPPSNIFKDEIGAVALHFSKEGRSKPRGGEVAADMSQKRMRAKDGELLGPSKLAYCVVLGQVPGPGLLFCGLLFWVLLFVVCCFCWARAAALRRSLVTPHTPHPTRDDSVGRVAEKKRYLFNKQRDGENKLRCLRRGTTTDSAVPRPLLCL